MKPRVLFRYILVIHLITITLFTAYFINTKINSIQKDQSPEIRTSGLFGTLECYYPQIFVDVRNNIHVSWILSEEIDGIQSFVLDYTKKNLNSKSWSKIDNIFTPVDPNFEDAGFIVDNNENLHLVWKENRGVGSGIYYKCWNASTNNWNPIETVTDFNRPASSDPKMIVDDNYNIHVVWKDWSNYSGEYGESNIFYRCKDSTLRKWQTIEVITLDTNSSYRANPVITIDSDFNIAVAWVEETGSRREILYKLRYKTNDSWINSEIISTTSRAGCRDPSIACDRANNLHFTWMEWTRQVHYAKFTRSTKEIYHKKISDGNLLYNPTMVLDTYENIHVAWEAGPSDDIDILYRCKLNTSSFWKDSVLVSTESTSHSTYPSISIGSNNILHFVWSDLSEYEGVEDDFDNDIFYKFKNLTSGEWSSTSVITSDIKLELIPDIIFNVVGLISVIHIGGLVFISIRYLKKKATCSR